MRADPAPRDASSGFLDGLTQTAFYLVVVLVLTRLTISEQLRDVFEFAGAPAPPGPSTILLLNLAALLPALLVLLRRAIDRTYVLNTRASFVLLGLLSVCVAGSCFMASDRFAAVVGTSTWCAAVAVAWAMSQLAGSPQRFRFVAAAVFGVLLIISAQTAIYHFFEAPAMVREWDAGQKQALFAARNWSADHPVAIQFDRKVREGDVLGFYKSPNTLAAVTLLAAIIAAAIALQRSRDGRDVVLIILPAFAAATAGPVLRLADSRTAFALAALAAVAAGITYAARRTIVRQRTAVALAGLCLFVLGVALTVMIGLQTGGLLQDSLTFRWRYWVASFHVVLTRPWTGVGWENFGSAYLPHRLPLAIEEIKDPHNLFVKFATETGIIGLVLVVAWLGRAAWELSRPAAARPSPPACDVLRPVSIVVGGFLLLHVVTRGEGMLNLLDLVKLPLFASLLTAALLVGTVRSIDSFVFETRRGRWIVGGVTLALGVFVLHNMVDFALFETGPMFLFMTLLGASLGQREIRRDGRRNTPMALTSLAVAATAAVAFALLIVLPVINAESHAAEARVLTAKNLPERATAAWRAAFATAPVANADYVTRAAETYRTSATMRPNELLGLLSQAVEADPASARGWLDRARARQSLPRVPNDTDRLAIESDYVAAVRRDPASTGVRVEFGQFLDAVGQPAKALEQFRISLWYSDQLPADEIRRLPEATATAVRQRVAQLKSTR